MEEFFINPCDFVPLIPISRNVFSGSTPIILLFYDFYKLSLTTLYSPKEKSAMLNEISASSMPPIDLSRQTVNLLIFSLAGRPVIGSISRMVLIWNFSSNTALSNAAVRILEWVFAYFFPLDHTTLTHVLSLTFIRRCFMWMSIIISY